MKPYERTEAIVAELGFALETGAYLTDDMTTAYNQCSGTDKEALEAARTALNHLRVHVGALQAIEAKLAAILKRGK